MLTLEQPSLFGGAVGGEPTLDDELVRVWEGLAAHRTGVCPVCQGEMSPSRHDDPQRRLAGRCASCGSILT